MKERAERPEPTFSTKVPRKRAIFKKLCRGRISPSGTGVSECRLSAYGRLRGEVKCAKNSEGDVPSIAVGSAAFPLFQNPIELSPAASNVASARR